MLYSAIFIILALLNLKPVCDTTIDKEDWHEIFPAVFNNPYTLSYSQYFPYIKIMWVLALVLGIAGYSRVFSVFGLIACIFIGTFGYMADIEDWDFVWIVSNSVAIYLLGFYFIYELYTKENEFSWSNMKKGRLLFVLFLPLLIWNPVSFKEGTWDFSLDQLLFNESGVSFCYVAASLLIVLLLFYPHVNKHLFGILTFSTSLLGVMAVVVFGYQKKLPLVIMHIPVIVVTVYSYYLYFYGEAIVKKTKEE